MVSEMRWAFRDISDDPSEKELTQQDQFNNDEVGLAEALVRETIQNSTDAQASADPVRVRFEITTLAAGPAARVFTQLAKGLDAHLTESRIAPPDLQQPVRLLVVEDFCTTGLEGSVVAKDDKQFSGFWRRFGRSSKGGKSGGRWGLGKLVFTSASTIRTVIGLTRRKEDQHTWLLGQAILQNHTIGDTEFDSVGFWCQADAKPGEPTSDPNLCEQIVHAAALTRRQDTGLSLIVPFLLPDIEHRHLIRAVVKNYYFPILSGQLIVAVGGHLVDKVAFESVAREFSADAIPISVLGFVRELQNHIERPDVQLPLEWQTVQLTAEMLGVQLANELRDRYRAGELLSVRAPMKVVSQKDGTLDTFIDIFLKAAKPGEKCQTLIVRNAITVPTEGKRRSLPDCDAALLARDPAISQLLGDAENPAHTEWNERATKLRNGWHRGSSVLRRVRAILPELHSIVAERIEREDVAALIDFFWISKGPSKGGRREPPGPPGPLPAPAPKPFRVEKKVGGFAILPGPHLSAEQMPLRIVVRCAYDVLTGDPFRGFSEYDFSFFGSTLAITKKDAFCLPREPNELEIEVRAPKFRVDVLGFDENRDLIIEAQS